MSTVLVLPGCFGAPRWKGKAPPNFDGTSFHNLEPFPRKGFADVVFLLLRRRRGVWTEHPNAAPGPPPPARVNDLRVTWVGHSTFLVQLDGLNVLTDPVWSETVGPLPGIGSARVRPPGIRFQDLPRIHVVVISHNHYDHCDLPTLRRLHAKHDPVFIAGLGTGGVLREAGITRINELAWWEDTDVRGLRVTAVPAQHGSRRGLTDGNANLWAGFLLHGRGGAVYFAGDTGWGGFFAEIRRRYGRVRLAMLPIGAYTPRWFMAPIHVGPKEAVRAHRVLGARQSVAMHWGTFQQAYDGERQPVRHLRRELKRQRVSRDRFWVLGFGEGRDVGPGANQQTPSAR